MNDAVLCSKIKTDNVSVSVLWDVCPCHYIRQRAIPRPCHHHRVALPLLSQRTRTGNEDSPAMSGPPPSPIRVPVALGRYRAFTRCILCVPRIPCPPRAPQLRHVSHRLMPVVQFVMAILYFTVIHQVLATSYWRYPLEHGGADVQMQVPIRLCFT